MFLQCAGTFVIIRFSHNETHIIMGRVKYKKQVICNMFFYKKVTKSHDNKLALTHLHHAPVP